MDTGETPDGWVQVGIGESRALTVLPKSQIWKPHGGTHLSTADRCQGVQEARRPQAAKSRLSSGLRTSPRKSLLIRPWPAVCWEAWEGLFPRLLEIHQSTKNTTVKLTEPLLLTPSYPYFHPSGISLFPTIKINHSPCVSIISATFFLICPSIPNSRPSFALSPNPHYAPKDQQTFSSLVNLTYRNRWKLV